MRIQILSDLHAELDPRRAKSDVVDLGVDLIVLAGDIDQSDAGARWAAEFRGVRIMGATLSTDLDLAGDTAFARWRLKQAFAAYKAIDRPQGDSLRPVDTQTPTTGKSECLHSSTYVVR